MTRAFAFTGILFLLTGVSSAAAQVQAPGAPPCYNELMPLKAEAEKRGHALEAAGKRKAPPQELCGLFKRFYEAEGKFLDYAEKNATWCGVPEQALKKMKANHAQTLKVRTRVCSIAAQPRPRGPTLGDALGTTVVPDATTTHTGRGTYDTLTGNALAR